MSLSQNENVTIWEQIRKKIILVLLVNFGDAKTVG